jgi:hypothetical protein
LLALRACGAANGLDAFDAEGFDDGAGHVGSRSLFLVLLSCFTTHLSDGGCQWARSRGRARRINTLGNYATDYHRNSSYQCGYIRDVFGREVDGVE